MLKRWGIAAVAVNWKGVYRKRYLEEVVNGVITPTNALDFALKRERLKGKRNTVVMLIFDYILTILF